MRLPIRLRLTLTFAVGMVVVLAALGGFLYVRLGHALLETIDMGLRSRAETIISSSHTGAFADQSGALIDPDEAFAQILDPRMSDTIVDSSPAVAAAPMLPASTLSSIVAPTFLDRRVPGVEDPARLLVVPISGGRLAVVGATLSDRQEALHRFLLELAIAAPVALALTSAAGWAVAGTALRPVERIRAEAAAISASEPERRLPVPLAHDELSRLATTLNEMLARLQDSLSRERRFVDDASHELRTPLAILKGELDLALARARAPEELEATVRRASLETDRLARLAEDLLVLARAHGRHLPVHRVEANPADVVGGAMKAHRRRAEEAGVRLTTDVPDGTFMLDQDRLRQVLENLLDNAIRHTPRGGEVLVRAAFDQDHLRLSVEDSGPGFPDGFLEQAFEPFARRNEDTNEGAGLGLAIVRAIAQAHGGTATGENPPTGGARVTLSIPS